VTTPKHRLVALVTADQKSWLASKTTAFKSIADVVRHIIDKAIADEKSNK
jgi:hypothetical protein